MNGNEQNTLIYYYRIRKILRNRLVLVLVLLPLMLVQIIIGMTKGAIEGFAQAFNEFSSCYRYISDYSKLPSEVKKEGANTLAAKGI